MWREPSEYRGGPLAGCRPPSHVELRVSSHSLYHSPAHGANWLAVDYRVEDYTFESMADEGSSFCDSQAVSPGGSGDEQGNRRKGGRAARARTRSLVWAQGQWLQAVVDIKVKGKVVLPDGHCAQIVALPADRPSHVKVTFSDASHDGQTRTLLVGKEKLTKMRYKDQRGQQQLADEAERQRTLSPGDPNWEDWMVETVDEGDEDGQAAKQLYTSKITGQQVKAGSAEQAAKKLWRVTKKHREVSISDASGSESTFASAAWGLQAREGVRGGPKFVGGKWNKQDPRRQGRWNGYARRDEDD
eukprot:TRINITY_DN6693_c1_g1_i1.p2 TRINITY_DN6693_c1_g1~~TRINITY_DN6693_c1_g1_i1.p2  ORF type:complete len:301 (+),score=62.35 TRINITY_DN6693_c1_g1_i1:98-1000(+)